MWMVSCKFHYTWCHDLPRVHDKVVPRGRSWCEDSLDSGRSHRKKLRKTRPLHSLKQGPSLSISFVFSQRHLTQSSAHNWCSKNVLNILNREEQQLVFTTRTWFGLQNYCTHWANCEDPVCTDSTQPASGRRGLWKDCFVNSAEYIGTQTHIAMKYMHAITNR